MHEVKSCGVLIYRGEPVESFLLMRHPNRWDIPKGHVDAGESEIECALRELVEETGIEPADIALDPDFRFVHRYQVRLKRLGGQPAEKTLVVFLGRLLREVAIRPTEHESFAWQPWRPPHGIQEKTIDPLLAAVEQHFASPGSS